MRIALISDVHGNAYALERVVRDISSRGADAVIFLGDIGFLGLYPQQCHDMLKALGCRLYIRGNTDENLFILDADPPFVPADESEHFILRAVDFMADRLDEASRAEILSREIAVRLDLGASQFLCCHGSPYCVTDRLVEEEMEGYRERIAAERVTAVACGHTHTPADFLIGSTRIVNPGGVGYSFDGNSDARYLILDVERDRIRTEPVTVAYDRDRYCADIRAQAPIFRDNLLHLIERGKPFGG